MRNCLMILLILFIALTLSACSQASQVENHAYVLVMGLDKTQDNQMKMTVQVPKISGNSSENENAGGGSNYMKFSVTAENYEACLEKLDWASPRDLNLSQIKLIVLSRELAESEACKAVIKNIAQTERLYTATRVAVCEGSASDFTASLEPEIGTRMSTDIEAMFKHYTERGYIPSSSLADLFYLTESIYSDPIVSFALLETSGDEKAEPEASEARTSALSGDVENISQSYESDIATRFLGSAIFVNGRMQGVFSGTQTMITGLLRNEIEALHYACGGQNITIVPARPVYVKVDTSASKLHIRIDAKLSVAAQENLPDEEELRRSLEQDILGVISSARALGAEPFGFAEQAARGFLTIEDWQKYSWREKFADAEIEIVLSFARSDA